METIWKSIPGYESLYEVSSSGQIRSCDRTIVCKDGKIKYLKGRILKPSLGKYGRNQYTLAKNGHKESVRGYRIVAEAFIPNPLNLPEVNHINGNNTDDRVENLEWVSFEDNLRHGLENELFNTYWKRFEKKENNKEKKIMMKENSKNVLNYLKAHNGEDLTAADVADALGLAKRSVDGIFTAMQKKGLGVRTPAEIELDDGSHKAIKLLSLTDAGMAFDPDADAE